MSNIVLSCENLTKTYVDGPRRVDVLKGINFEIAAGELVSIMGSSGSGKSTLLHLLGGLDKATSGEILIAGKSLKRLSDKDRCLMRNHHLGFVYQFHHLLPEFNALENVAMPLLIRGGSVKKAKEKAVEFLTAVGLEHRLEHRIGELSGGERQRAAVARALVTEPQCVLADEPTGNLDNETAAELFELMLSLQSRFKTSFVLVTHDKLLAAKTQKVYQLERGLLTTSPRGTR
jgi:lipoprotein-releasing system ATP-binding protein